MKQNNKKIAVAIKYDNKKNSAPKVIAKGKGIIADNIIKKGEDVGIKQIENKKLAEELITLNIEQEIPEHLYKAVAEILTFIYNLDSVKDAVYYDQQ